MPDTWSIALAMLQRPVVIAIDWPAEHCRYVSQWSEEPARPRPRPRSVTRFTGIGPVLDVADRAVLEALAQRRQETRALARLLGTSRREMAGRIARLRELGMVRTDREGIWEPSE